jgi:hypothetical protein
MSGPLLSTELARSGISPAQTKVADDRKKKEDANSRVSFGDDDDSKSTSEAAAKTAKKQAAKEARSEGGGEKVKRKRVKLKDLAQREYTKETGSRESQKTEKASKTSAQTKVKVKTTETAETQETSLTERAQEAGQARASLGLTQAAGLLMQQSRLTESSVKYETARQVQDHDDQGLSKTGQQKWMLNNLISMTNICVEQHTGGKAGEAYESRRDNRLIYMALRGLRDGNNLECKNPSTGRTGMSRGEYEANQKKAESIIANIIEPAVRPEHLPEYSEVA